MLWVLTDLVHFVGKGSNYFAPNSVKTLWRAVFFLPALAGGIWLGNRGFMNAEPVAFRRWVLRLLMLLAVLAGGRA